LKRVCFTTLPLYSVSAALTSTHRGNREAYKGQ
jgi:hypothetical protein